MSSIHTSEHFSSISIGDHHDNDQKILLSNQEDSEIDLKNELVTLEGQYKSFFKSLNEMNACLDKLVVKFNQSIFDKLYGYFIFLCFRYSDFKKLKSRLNLINENLQILQETSKEKTNDSEIKSLFKKTMTAFEEVQKVYLEVGNKTKEIITKSASGVFNTLKTEENILEGDLKKQFEGESEVENIFYKIEDDQSQGQINISQNSNNPKLQIISKYSTEIKNLTTEIQKKINEQGEDLNKLEELLDENKIYIRKSEIDSYSKEMTDESENQSRTNRYLAAWCVGSILIFTLMILLKYVINKSHNQNI